MTRLPTHRLPKYGLPKLGAIAAIRAATMTAATLAITLLLAIGHRQLASAQESPTDQPLAALPDTNPTLEALKAAFLDVERMPLNFAPAPGTSAITHETLSDRSFTEPSLWWQQDQVSPRLGGERLVVGWTAYPVVPILPGEALMDISINGQIWNLLNYLEQYSLVNQFGQTAQAYGYQLRFFVNGSLTGAYICDFSQTVAIATPPDLNSPEMSPCLVSLDYRGRGGIRGRTTSIFR
jgi:hypothetical protein